MKILIVDDDVTNRTVLEALLKKEGHETVSAENGAEAVAFVERYKPDIIFMDVMMPVMNGFTATREIRNEYTDEFIPIIFLTALTDEASMIRGIECGGDDFLTKPYSPALLRSKINAMSRIKSLHKSVTRQKDQLEIYQEKTEHELQLAKHVFDAVTNKVSLEAPYLKTWSSTVSHFSGDMVLHGRTPSGQLNVMLGDFAGHGLSSAIGALPAADVFYSMTTKGASIADIAAEINRKLHIYLPTGHFCAAVLVRIDSNKGSIEIWNGGVPPVQLIGYDGKILHAVESTKLPLGVENQRKFDYTTETIRLSPVKSIILCSDGLIELQNQDGEYLGIKGLIEAISSVKSQESVLDAIKQYANDFILAMESNDDLSLVEICCDLPAHTQPDRPDASGMQEAVDTEWGIDLYLSVASLRISDPLPMLMDWLMRMRMLEGERQRMYMILSELINNAIEHGILGLDSEMKETAEGFDQYYKLRSDLLESNDEGYLRIHLEKLPGADQQTILIRIEDSGNGFDHSEIISQLDNGKNYGRGIALVKTLCNEIDYKGRGNFVEVECNLEEANEFGDEKMPDERLNRRAV